MRKIAHSVLLAGGEGARLVLHWLTLEEKACAMKGKSWVSARALILN